MGKIQRSGGGYNVGRGPGKTAVRFSTKKAAQKYQAAKHIHCGK